MLERRYAFALAAALVAGLTLTQQASNNANPFAQSNGNGGGQNSHLITITPWGPTQKTIDDARDKLLQHPAIQEYLRGARSRLLSFAFADKGKANGNIERPDSYRAVLFDYTNNRAYIAAGRFDSSTVRVARYSVQPEPSEEEFNEAVEILSKDSKIGPAIGDKSLAVYRPMPPLINGSLPVGKVHRIVAVGLQSTDGNTSSEIVGVDMISDTVIRFSSGAPPTSMSAPTACGPPVAGGGTGKGLSGQYQLIISRNGTEIWNLIVVRPSASSGTNGSGIEVLNVNYRGQRVLARGHAPILNVQYDRNICGPYRDWCYSENQFVAAGTDVPGTGTPPAIRICTSPPSTILDSGTDLGSFRGVAIYDNREEVQLITEMDAGWYRYLMEWTFTDGGIIRPRYGFGSTTNSCVCNVHNHHVYWRFDFDVGGPSNYVTEQSPAGTANIGVEAMRPRLFGPAQTWTIQNSGSLASCTLIPGPRDGNYDKYGKGDVWVLLNKDSGGCGTPLNCQLDDGTCLNCSPTQINIDPFVNGESVMNADIVIWYGAHFNHHDGASGPETLIGDHVVGPDIVLRGF